MASGGTDSEQEKAPDTQAGRAMLNLLLTRRSVVARDLAEPGPTGADLSCILEAGWRVPDHGKLGPWRFIVFEGTARKNFGAVLRKAFLQREAQADATRQQVEAERLLRAPVVVAVISCVQTSSVIPEWEQVLSAGAVCQNMLVAASALGFGAQWLTEWYAFDATVNQALGLEAQERVAGYLYFGTRKSVPSERTRPPLDARITRWGE